MKYTKRQIVNFVLASNQSSPKGESQPFNINSVLKNMSQYLIG